LNLTPGDVGRLARVGFGRGARVGVIVALAESSELPGERIKPVEGVRRDLPPLPPDWFRLMEFCASYYQTPLGEAMLSALPAALRRVDPPKARAGRAGKPPAAAVAPELTAEQRRALERIAADGPGFHAYLLHGVTGSGKTEVYLRLLERTLAAGRSALLLVPEINLTPQFEARVAGRFPDAGLVCLHSDLAAPARARHWKAALEGRARIVLGTRLAVFTPMPDLGLIVVDEEHDPSFKQQDGMRYSARDLAVFRARDRDIPVVLGSATPSLESWANAAAEPGRPARYTRLTLEERAVAGARLPAVQRIDTRGEKLQEGLSGALLEAIARRLRRGEQSLVFLNRRGYAPVLSCPACGWVSQCPHCSANRVVHLADRRLRCHHCGAEAPIPRACPTCGNQDIHPFGQGTQRIEARLKALFPAARVLRLDRDAARTRARWEALLATVAAGEADILVGTQIMAKGHDFPKLTLVGVVGADASLHAADFRAPERLFQQLLQVGGRAGRAELPGEVLIQTEYPEHPLYRCLARHDFAAFAAMELDARQAAAFPPFSHQAMLKADAPQLAAAVDFLRQARQLAARHAPPTLRVFDPVPMRLTRLARRERAQLLVEAGQRGLLQDFLTRWLEDVRALRAPRDLRWQVDVDPLEV
jgi:primosomal protein N' (replication factor Y)